MARHKVYMTVYTKNANGDTVKHVEVGNRATIHSYGIHINADINDGLDKGGVIRIKHFNGEVIVEIDCPDYHVNIKNARSVME